MTNTKAKGNSPMVKHTATPWRIDGFNITTGLKHIDAGPNSIYKKIFDCKNQYLNGEKYPIEEAIANAEFIVRAVNSHEALVEALFSLRKAMYQEGTSKALKQAFEKTHELAKILKQAECK